MERIVKKIISGWYQSDSGNWYNKGVCNGMAAHYESICDECGCTFFARKFKAKGAKGGSCKSFCSKSCAKTSTVRLQDLSHLKKYEFKEGNTPHNYKGRIKHSAGYIVRTGNKKRELEHRVLIEQMLGRQLTRHEVVHHVNGDVTDNRLENLRIMSQSEHIKLHWNEGAYEDR